MKLKIIVKCKPLCQINNDVFLVYRRGCLCTYDYKKKAINDLLTLPLSKKEFILGKFRLTSRLFRAEPRDVEYLGDNKCIIFSNVRFDLVLYTTPPITFCKAVEYVKKRDGAKSYLLLKDIFPQNAVDIGIMRKDGIKGLIYQYFRAKEKSCTKYLIT